MNKNLFFLLFSILILGNSCSNDFDVAAPWKDIPIVYGLINLDDEVHYIRVEKAFLDPDADALELAKNPDSLYYEDLTVQFEVDGTIHTLERVDGTDVGFPREDGIFATEPNYLYKIDKSELGLSPNDMVNLIIDRGNGLPLVQANTIVQSDLVLKSPNPEASAGPKLDFTSANPEKISWQGHETASVFDMRLFFHYIEYPASRPNEFVEKTIEWTWIEGVGADAIRDRSVFAAEKETNEFYEFLANNIEADPDMERLFNKVTLQIISGGESLEKYITVVQANTGITGSQEVPTYTNLSEGLGIFSSLSVFELPGIDLSQVTKQEVKVNELTAPLNFQ